MSQTGPTSEGRSSKWATLVLSAVIGPLAIFGLTRPGGPLNHQDAPVLGGELTDVVFSDSTSACCWFSVQVELEGLKGQDALLTATVVDVGLQQESEPFEVLGFQAEAERDRARWDANVPISYPGTYYVRFVLYDPDGVELDRAESETFDVTA